MAVDPTCDPDLFDRPGAARLCNIAESTVEFKRRNGTFPPGEKIGQSRRWHRRDLEAFLMGKRNWQPLAPFKGRPHFRIDVPSSARASAVNRRLLRYGFSDFSVIAVGPAYAVLLGLEKGDVVQTAANLRVFVPDLKFQFCDERGEPADISAAPAPVQEPTVPVPVDEDAADFLL